MSNVIWLNSRCRLKSGIHNKICYSDKIMICYSYFSGGCVKKHSNVCMYRYMSRYPCSRPKLVRRPGTLFIKTIPREIRAGEGRAPGENSGAARRHCHPVQDSMQWTEYRGGIENRSPPRCTTKPTTAIVCIQG